MLLAFPLGTVTMLHLASHTLPCSGTHTSTFSTNMRHVCAEGIGIQISGCCMLPINKLSALICPTTLYQMLWPVHCITVKWHLCYAEQATCMCCSMCPPSVLPSHERFPLDMCVCFLDAYFGQTVSSGIHMALPSLKASLSPSKLATASSAHLTTQALAARHSVNRHGRPRLYSWSHMRQPQRQLQSRPHCPHHCRWRGGAHKPCHSPRELQPWVPTAATNVSLPNILGLQMDQLYKLTVITEDTWFDGPNR